MRVVFKMITVLSCLLLTTESLVMKTMIGFVEELTINNNNQQRFYHHWNLASLALKEGESLEYYFEVWDNDAVNGSKSSRSETMTHESPTKEEHEQQIQENNESLKTDIEDAILPC